MAKTSINIKGADELKAKIQRAGAKGRPMVEKELLKTGLLVEGGAKLLAPVKYGMLRNSYNTIKRGDSVIVGTGVHYAPHQEYGTVHHKAQPHLIPSYHREVARMIPRLSRALGNITR